MIEIKPTELRDVMRRGNLTGGKAAKTLGVSTRMVRKWISDTEPQTIPFTAWETLCRDVMSRNTDRQWLEVEGFWHRDQWWQVVRDEQNMTTCLYPVTGPGCIPDIWGRFGADKDVILQSAAVYIGDES